MAYSQAFKDRLASLENTASQTVQTINSYRDKVENLFKESDSDLQSIKESLKEVDEAKTKFDSQIEPLVDFLEENPNLSEEAQDLKVIIENIKGLQNQITVIYKQVYGFDKRDSEGKILNHEEGLKDKLEKSYNDVAQKIVSLEKNSKEQYEQYLSEWETNFQGLKKAIESLLPAATSAGLASAYNDKKEEEEKSLRWGFGWFVVVIAIMVVIGVSLVIPKYAPAKDNYIAFASRLVLFAPLIWIGIYQNKKINISKKIIEEYAHKAAMMKTFNGLFIQIFKTDKNGEYISSDKVRETFLLQTLGTVNKNPAECISDCNKSDNPMIDVVKLALKKSKRDASDGTFNTILKNVKDFMCSCEEVPEPRKVEQNNNKEDFGQQD